MGRSMRVLEARFHPLKRSGNLAVVVGYVLCEGRRAFVRPAPSPPDGQTPDPRLPAMLEKLRYIVETSGKHAYERLASLNSDYWSFTDLENAKEA
jgi:hypothetical protein